MPYYTGDCYPRGDYYQGDYYRGDPFIHKQLGRAVRKIGGVVGKLGPIAVALGSGPAGVAAGLARAGAGALLKRSGASPPFLPPSPITSLVPQPPIFGFGPETMEIAQQPGMSLTPSGAVVPCVIKGYRPNKSGYYRRNLTAPGTGTYIPKGAVCVKVRRMNPANPRALRRAISRAAGFVKLARRSVGLFGLKIARSGSGRAVRRKRR